MWQLIVKAICIIIILLAVICIYDARILTRKFFSFGDQNEGANGLKILGFIVVMICGISLLFIK